MAQACGRHASSDRISVRSAVGPLLGMVWQAMSTVALVVSATAMLAGAAAVFVFDVAMSPVLTGSMSPTFEPGAAILTRPTPVQDVRAGDVIVFVPPGEQASFAHRVVSAGGESNRPDVVTKGDANPAPDSWKAQLVGPTVPEVVLSVPHLGRVMTAAHQPSGRAVLVALAGLTFCVFGTRAVLGPPRSSARPRRSHDPRPPLAV